MGQDRTRETGSCQNVANTDKRHRGQRIHRIRQFCQDVHQNFGDIARPLHELTKKGTTFQWKQEHERAFQRMRNAITADPVLMLPDPSKPFEVEGNLARETRTASCTQLRSSPRNSRDQDSTTRSTTKNCSQSSKHFRNGGHTSAAQHNEVQVHTDHKNLRYFTTTKVLNGRQTRWAEFLSEFNFTIHYKKGSENARADALSRRADHHDNTSEASPPLLHQQTDGSPRHAPQPTEDYEIAALQQQLEDPEARPLQPFVECCAVFRERRLERDFQGIIADDERDKWREEPESKIAGLRLEGTRLWYHDRAYIRPSNQKELIQKIHGSRPGGHMGISKTIAKVKQNYDFPGIKQATKEILAECDLCGRSKSRPHKPYGLLQPLPVAERPWSSVTMDFITKPPTLKDSATGTKYDSILTVVDRLTKWSYFLPYKESWSAEQLADVIYRNVTSVHDGRRNGSRIETRSSHQSFGKL